MGANGRNPTPSTIQAAMAVPVFLSSSSTMSWPPPAPPPPPCCCSCVGAMSVMMTTTTMTSSSGTRRRRRRRRTPLPLRAALVAEAAGAAEQGRRGGGGDYDTYAVQLFQDSSRDRANDMQAEARAMARAANASVYSPQFLSIKFGSRPIKVGGGILIGLLHLLYLSIYLSIYFM